MPGSLNTACYQAVILHTFDVPTAAGNRPSRVTEYGIESLESLFVMLARALQSCIGRSNISDIVSILHTHHAQGTHMADIDYLRHTHSIPCPVLTAGPIVLLRTAVIDGSWLPAHAAG